MILSVTFLPHLSSLPLSSFCCSFVFSLKHSINHSAEHWVKVIPFTFSFPFHVFLLCIFYRKDKDGCDYILQIELNLSFDLGLQWQKWMLQTLDSIVFQGLGPGIVWKMRKMSKLPKIGPL